MPHPTSLLVMMLVGVMVKCQEPGRAITSEHLVDFNLLAAASEVSGIDDETE